MPFINGEGLEVIKEIFNAKFAGKNADGAVVSVGADYAEYGDWYDGNPDNQNRKGYFVTMQSGTNKIRKATSASAIVGVTTDSAGFIGNYSKDAESDQSKGLVGIVGQVSVIDNGTCTVGGRCMPNDSGTASPSSNNCGYLVIERIDSTHVKILVSPAIDMIQRIKTDMDSVENSISSTALNAYPVGSVYISYVPTSPASLFGGEWVQITDRFLRAANDVNTGGSDTHTLTVEQMPEHSHSYDQMWTKNHNLTNQLARGSAGFELTYNQNLRTGTAGSGEAHNNMPAYQDLYVWRRTN